MSIPSYFIKNDPETWDISAFASQQLLDFPGLTFDELQNSIYRSLKFIEGSENIAKKVRDRASTLIEGWKGILSQIKNLYARHQKTATVQINNNSTINANNIEQLYQTGVAHFGIDSEHAQQSQSESDKDENIDLTSELTEDEEYNLNSFTSDDYHPLRKHVYTVDNIPEWEDDGSTWMIGDLDILDELRSYREISTHLSQTQGNPSDCRYLSLCFIFPLFLEYDQCVSKYMGLKAHTILKESMMDILNDGLLEVSDNIVLWSASLSFIIHNPWTAVSAKCATILNKATSLADDVDILAAQIMLALAPRLARLPIDNSCEDTFVHTYLDCIIDQVFSSEPLFRQSWANKTLKSSQSTIFKPDWVLYVVPWYIKREIGACEVKAPNKTNPGPISDFAKLALQMKSMVNELVHLGVDDPRAYGVLVEGFTLKTFVMDMKCKNVYRMVQLGSCRLVSKLAEFGCFPVVFRMIMQVKAMAKETAEKVEALELLLAKGKRKGCDLSDSIDKTILEYTKRQK